ncbi:MAG: hypothetical protein O7G85_15770 [Planctomycetota bacterium]|nr:hypothetical protein [Planctomycetota bacterium]
MPITKSVLNQGHMIQSMFLGVFVGMNAALPMYLWQSNAQVAVACFIIVGYTAWLVAATWAEIAGDFTSRHNLYALPINRPIKRFKRLLLDPGFWWSLMFGGAIITGAVWYAEFRQTPILVTTGAVWGLIAFMLNFGLTLAHPTTHCRRCGYQLISHMDPENPEQILQCPECGTAWMKNELLLNRNTPVMQSHRAA